MKIREQVEGEGEADTTPAAGASASHAKGEESKEQVEVQVSPSTAELGTERIPLSARDLIASLSSIGIGFVFRIPNHRPRIVILPVILSINRRHSNQFHRLMHSSPRHLPYHPHPPLPLNLPHLHLSPIPMHFNHSYHSGIIYDSVSTTRMHMEPKGFHWSHVNSQHRETTYKG